MYIYLTDLAIDAEYCKEAYDRSVCSGLHNGVAMPVTALERSNININAITIDRLVKTLTNDNYNFYSKIRGELRYETLEQLSECIKEENKDRRAWFRHEADIALENAKHRRTIASYRREEYESSLWRDCLIIFSGVKKKEDGSWGK